MEHLLPKNKRAPLVVPCWVPQTTIQPIQDFDSYPEHHGWDFTAWRQHDRIQQGLDLRAWLQSNNKTLPEFLEFWQTWLWFSLLASALQAPIETAAFVRLHDDGKTYLTTANLERYIVRFGSRLSKDSSYSSPAAKEALLAEFTKSMKVARPYLYTLSQTILYENPPQVQALREIHFASSLLRWALNVYIGPLLGGSAATYGIAGLLPLAGHYMKANGWCPHSIERIAKAASHDVHAYACAIGTVRTQKSHAACSARYCKANQAGDDFKTLHASLGCDCPHVGPDINSIAQVLRKGSIPALAVQFPEVGDSAPIFEVKPIDKTIPYAAISHVWADGLGNPDSNTIPLCQLQLICQALQKHTIEEGQTLYFWLDTLCIPVDKTLQNLRDFSIERMHNIYRDSYGVLVLDPDFDRMTMKSPPCEVLTRVAISGWSTRLWTYQEGALPQRLFIRVSDGMIDIGDLMEQFRTGKLQLSPLQEILTVGAFGASQILVPRRQSYQRDPNDSNECEIWVETTLSAMRDRITSRPGDEAVCAATSLGYDPSPLLKLKPDQMTEQELLEKRMIEFLRIMPTIPIGILFSTGPRLRQKGFRWAPESFLAPHGGVRSVMPSESRLEDGTIYRRPMAHLHPKGEGIVTHLAGFRIAKLDLRQTRWEIRLSNNISVYVSHFFNDSSTNISLKGLVILLAEPLNVLASQKQSASQTGLLVAPMGKARDPSASRFSLKMIDYGQIMGAVDVEYEIAGRTNKGMAEGDILQPKWWLLDGT